MEQKAFDLIAEKVGEALAEQGFVRQKQTVMEENGDAVLFTSENVAYSVLYNKKQKRFELRTCPMTDDGPSNTWKSLSTWLFDPDTGSIEEANSIVSDFCETVQGPKRIVAVQQVKKKSKKGGDENNPDPVFFYNRLVSVFPELKMEMNQERVIYGDVRSVAFARASVLPKMEALASQYPGSEPFKKMCDVINDMYSVGDLDVRSIITMVLLNGITDEKALSNIEAQFSEDLKKSYDKGRKMKGKKIKPEKKKKRPKYDAGALNTLRNS